MTFAWNNLPCCYNGPRVWFYTNFFFYFLEMFIYTSCLRCGVWINIVCEAEVTVIDWSVSPQAVQRKWGSNEGTSGPAGGWAVFLSEYDRLLNIISFFLFLNEVLCIIRPFRYLPFTFVYDVIIIHNMLATVFTYFPGIFYSPIKLIRIKAWFIVARFPSKLQI